jgi:hypothetical protein
MEIINLGRGKEKFYGLHQAVWEFEETNKVKNMHELLEQLENDYIYLYYVLGLENNAGNLQYDHAKNRIKNTQEQIVNLFNSHTEENKNVQ